MSMSLAYMAGGEGVGVRGFKMFSQRGSDFFSTCFVCVREIQFVCVCEGVRFSTSPFVKKNNRPPSY